MRETIVTRINQTDDSKVITEIVWEDDVLIRRVRNLGDPQIIETIIKDPDKLKAEQIAETDLQNIPNWVTWTMNEAVSYIENNVTDLNSAKVVLKAMARVIVALRNKTFPLLKPYENQILNGEVKLSGQSFMKIGNIVTHGISLKGGSEMNVTAVVERDLGE